MNTQNYGLSLLATGVGLTLFVSGVFIGHQNPALFGLNKESGASADTIDRESDQAQSDLDLFWEVWDIARENHVDSENVTEQDLLYGAINGMLNYGYKDEFSYFYKPDLNTYKNEDLQGSFGGVGIELSQRNGQLVIVTPLKGTPGEEAGLLAGDAITTVDGETTEGITVLDAVMMIRGEVGTDVTLGIQRLENDGTLSELEVDVTRATIDVESVVLEEIEAGIYRIDVRNFAADTVDEWNRVVDEVVELNPQGLILDLRNNSGGYVFGAVHLISEFVEEGVAVIEDLGDRQIETDVLGNGSLYDVPLVVLVNQGTASSSEIVSGALQDYERGVIIGTRTFGKGVMQQVFDVDIPDAEVDGSVHVVIAKWYTPEGRWLHNEGLLPDIEIQPTLEQLEADEDPALDRAVEELR